VMLFL